MRALLVALVAATTLAEAPPPAGSGIVPQKAEPEPPNPLLQAQNAQAAAVPAPAPVAEKATPLKEQEPTKTLERVAPVQMLQKLPRLSMAQAAKPWPFYSPTWTGYGSWGWPTHLGYGTMGWPYNYYGMWQGPMNPSAGWTGSHLWNGAGLHNWWGMNNWWYSPLWHGAGALSNPMHYSGLFWPVYASAAAWPYMVYPWLFWWWTYFYWWWTHFASIWYSWGNYMLSPGYYGYGPAEWTTTSNFYQMSPGENAFWMGLYNPALWSAMWTPWTTAASATPTHHLMSNHLENIGMGN